MNIISSDFKRSISLGGSDTWKTLCATIKYYFSSQKSEYEHVFLFIEDNYLSSKECLTAAKEFNFLRDALSQIAPSKIIYDDKKPDQLPPWGKDISPVITSCANYLTTGSGDDLLAEIVKILVYAAYSKADIKVV